MRAYRTQLLVACGVISLTAPEASLAQTTDQVSDETQVEEIIVTATRRADSVQDIPMSVTAIGSEALAERNIQTVQDVGTIVPGLNFGNFANQVNINIRGVGTSFASGTAESSAAVHIDGVYLPQNSAISMGIFDLARVEVLKGPQGTLYGRNSTAGVVNFITASPSKTPEAGVTVGAGSYDLRTASGYVTGPLSESVAARVAVDFTDRSGYVKNNVTGQRLDDLNALGARLSLDFDLSETFSSEFRATYRKEQFNGPYFDSFDPNFVVLGTPVSGVDLRPYYLNSNLLYDSERELYFLTLRNEIFLSDTVSLETITGWSKFNLDSFYDTLGTTSPSLPLTNTFDSDGFSQEVLVKGEGRLVDWVLGAYYSKSSTDRFSLAGLSVLGGVDEPRRQSDKARSASVFGDVTVAVSDQTRLFAGARYIDQKNTTEDFIPGVCGTLTKKENALTGRAGIQHDFTADVMVYAQASRGYKAGAFQAVGGCDSYKPETVNALEAGVKSRLLDGSLVLNLSVYYNQIRNLQLEQISLAGNLVVNAPKSHSTGAELQFTWRLTDKLQLDGTAVLMEAKYDEFNGGDLGLGPPFGESLKGNNLNNSPTASGILGAEYRFPLGAAGQIKLRGEVKATTKYYLREVVRPYTVQDGYVTGNAYLTWSDIGEKYTVTAWAKNIGDEPVLVGILGLPGVVGTYGPPRTYGVEFSARF